MSVRRIVPDIRSTDLDASRRFYEDVIGLQVAMDMGFVMTLLSPNNPTAHVTLMRSDNSAALFSDISIEVADVRRFFVKDPSGTIVNVLSHVTADV